MSPLLWISLAAFASTAVILTVTGISLFRNGHRSLAYWLFGWSALAEGAFVQLLIPSFPPIAPMSPIFTAVVAPFMLLGAAAHSGRREPAWVLVVSFVLGAVRVAAYLVGARDFAISIALATEPMLAAATAWLLLHPHPPASRPVAVSDRALALGFVAYGAVEFFDASSHARGSFGLANWIAWVGVAVPLGTLQIALHLEGVARTARRHEEDLHAFSTRLEALAASPLDFLAEFDALGRLVWTSSGAALAAGRPLETLVGCSVLDFLDPDGESSVRDALSTRGRLTPADVESAAGTSHLAILPDGSRRWFEFVGTCRRSHDGELRIVARLRDVTSRTEQERALRRSEERLRRSERIAGVGSWELDLKRREVVLSDEMRRIHGLRIGAGPALLEQVTRCIVPEDLEAATAMRRAVVERGENVEATFRIRRADDGRLRTVRVRCELDRDRDGHPAYLVGTTFDVTEQVELLHQLERRQRWLRALLDSDIVSVFVADAKGRILEASGGFLSLLGYDASDLPLDWRLVTAPEDRAADERRAALADPNVLPQPFEKRFLARNGERIPMLMSCTTISPGAAFLIGADLRERKREDDRRARQQRELEETVVARTRELVESRNRLLAQERLAAVGTLAAGVAHQINNPIGAILNCAEYALLCRDDDEASEIFERALRDNLQEARRCARIIRSMLQFSRDQPTAKWAEDLGRVVRRAHRAIGAYAKDREATVTITTTDQPLLVRMSPIEIEQAIVNVLHNAIESRAKDASVSILLTRRDEHAVLEVGDDGRGIPAEQLERVFEPFFSTRTREGGTGLGLSVTHGVFADHGGQVRIESIPGVGTRVVLTLPLLEGPAEGCEEADRHD